MSKIIIEVSDKELTRVVTKLIEYGCSFSVVTTEKVHPTLSGPHMSNSMRVVLDIVKELGGTALVEDVAAKITAHGLKASTAGPALSSLFYADLLTRLRVDGKMIYSLPKK